MRYLPLTKGEREEIQKELGIKNVRELFSDIPEDKAYFSLDHIPDALSEPELIQKFKELTQKNRFQNYTSYLGGGAYQHFVPEVVNFLSTKGEFLTPYTPYQPEVSQGSLQGMFEYQTMMSMLTGMDIANSSLYDGGTAAAEGILLALRKSRKKRILVAANLHPEYIEIMETYVQHLDFEMETVSFNQETGKLNLDDLKQKMDENTAGLIFQSPNFLGVIEDGCGISNIIHEFKAYSIQVVAEAISLPFLTPPGKLC